MSEKNQVKITLLISELISDSHIKVTQHVTYNLLNSNYYLLNYFLFLDIHNARSSINII